MHLPDSSLRQADLQVDGRAPLTSGRLPIVDAARSEIGVIELREGFGSANLVVSIFLTDKQQAFGNVPAKWVTGPVDLYATRSSRHVGTYTRADNVATRSIIVNSTASSLFLTAADADGNMLLDFIGGSSWGGFGAP